MSITDVVRTLSVDSGAFLYHLLIMLMTEAVSIVALIQWHTTRNREHYRVLGAFAAASFLQILLLLSSLFQFPSLSPLASAANIIALALVAWATIATLPDCRIGRLPLICSLVATLICSAVFLPGWNAALIREPGIAYETFWQQSFWYGVSLTMALLTTVVLLRRADRARRWLLGAGFALVTVSFLIRFANTFLPDHANSIVLTPSAFVEVLHLALSQLGRLISVAGYLLFAIAFSRSAIEDHRESRTELQDASEEALRRTRELLFLVETSQAIGKSLDLDTILYRVVENVTLALDADRCAVILADSDNDQRLELAAHYTPLLQGTQPSPKGIPSLVQQPALVAVLERQEQLILRPGTDTPLLESLYTLLGSPQIGPALIQPLVRQQRALGLLLVGNDHCQRPFTPDEGRLTQSIATQIASAIDNARLYRDLAVQTRQLAELLQSQKESNRQQTAILESIAEGVIISDQDDRIVIVNAAAEQILGVSRQRIQGLLLERMLSQISLGPSANWQAITHSETPVQTVFNLENKIVHVNSAPVLTSDGEHLGTVAVLRDITKETEAERAKSDFITVASHELRTPLTAIRGYAEALSSGMAGKVTETQYHFLRIIRDNALRMANLIENLIAVSEIEKEFLKLDYEYTDLHLLIGDVVVSFQSQLKDRQLEIELDLDPELPLVEADPARIRQILDNLVSNAIKFTYPGGHITVAARSLQADEGQQPTQYAIWVSDTGIGIPAEEQTRIWERFYRPANPLAEEASGLGMGLSIVKSLTEAHGGRVWLESTPGVGSTFTVLLPIRRNQHANQAINR